MRFFPFSFCIFVFNFSFSQGINFELVYGTTAYDDVKCIIQTLDSGYAVVGTTSGFGNGQSDIYLTKISKDGKVTWQQALGGARVEQGNSLVQTPDSGFAIAGFANDSVSNGYDVYLVRTDKNGSLQWSKTFGGSDWDFGNCILQTSDGGYIICGETFSKGNGNGDVYLLKTDSLGNLKWDSAYGGTAEDVGKFVCQSSDGGFFITGETKSFGQGDKDIFLLKTDSIGNLKWTKTYGGTGEDLGSEGKFTSDGGYIVIGSTKSFDGGNLYEYYLLKTDSSGDTLWARREKKSYNFLGASVCATTDGGYIFGGTWNSNGDNDFFLYKTDGGGWWQNLRGYGGLKIENGISVKQTFDGGYVIAGTTTSYGAGAPNIYLVKTGANLSSTGNVIDVVSVNEIETANEKIFFYPNPAIEKIFLNAEENSDLEIINAIGKEIFSGKIYTGQNQLDISNFPDGIYFLKIKNEKLSGAGKIIIQH